MKVHLREITDPEQALSLAPLLESAAQDALAEFRDGALPAGLARRAMERYMGPEASGAARLLLVAEDAEAAGTTLGAVLVGPLLDPLALEEQPAIVLLWTDPGWRHRGLARRLVARARQLLLERGHPVLLARAGHNDDARISIGERMGFVRTWEWMALE